jgi:glutathione S-transferase
MQVFGINLYFDMLFIFIDRYGFGCLDSETVMKVRQALNDDVLPRHLRFLERLLEKSASGWIANTVEPSIADFVLVPRLQWLVQPGVHDGISTDLLESFPGIKNLIEKFLHLPAIEKYYQEHAAV